MSKIPWHSAHASRDTAGKSPERVFFRLGTSHFFTEQKFHTLGKKTPRHWRGVFHIEIRQPVR